MEAQRYVLESVSYISLYIQNTETPIYYSHAKQFKFHRVTIDVWLRHEDKTTLSTQVKHTLTQNTYTKRQGRILPPAKHTRNERNLILSYSICLKLCIVRYNIRKLCRCRGVLSACVCLREQVSICTWNTQIASYKIKGSA